MPRGGPAGRLGCWVGQAPSVRCFSDWPRDGSSEPQPSQVQLSPSEQLEDSWFKNADGLLCVRPCAKASQPLGTSRMARGHCRIDTALPWSRMEHPQRGMILAPGCSGSQGETLDTFPGGPDGSGRRRPPAPGSPPLSPPTPYVVVACERVTAFPLAFPAGASEA